MTWLEKSVGRRIRWTIGLYFGTTPLWFKWEFAILNRGISRWRQTFIGMINAECSSGSWVSQCIHPSAMISYRHEKTLSKIRICFNSLVQWEVHWDPSIQEVREVFDPFPQPVICEIVWFKEDPYWECVRARYNQRRGKWQGFRIRDPSESETAKGTLLSAELAYCYVKGWKMNVPVTTDRCHGTYPSIC